jgi:hypothetical protein
MPIIATVVVSAHANFKDLESLLSQGREVLFIAPAVRPRIPFRPVLCQQLTQVNGHLLCPRGIIESGKLDVVAEGTCIPVTAMSEACLQISVGFRKDGPLIGGFARKETNGRPALLI